MQYSSSFFSLFQLYESHLSIISCLFRNAPRLQASTQQRFSYHSGHSHVLCKVMLWKATIFQEITGFLLILTEKIFSNFLRSCFTLFKPTVNLLVALKWTEFPLSLQERKGISWILFPVQQKKTLSVIFHFNVKIKYLGHQICKYK